MADGKFICYSFYVPDNDQQLQQFIDSQGNLSLTVRLLIKAFLANNGGMDPERIDVGVMDLGALIRSMQARPDIMDPMRTRGSRRDGARTSPARQAPAQDAPEARGSGVSETESAPEARPVPAREPESAHEPESAPAHEAWPDGDGSGDGEEDFAPQVTVERNADADAHGAGGRSDYNKAMRAGMQPVDDIAAMMGEM